MHQVEPGLSLRRQVPYVAVILSAASFSLALPSWAQTADGFHPYVAYSVTYDDNVLGVPSRDAAVALTGSSKTSDVSRSAQAGLQVNKYLGRQQLIANLGVSNVTYDRYSQLGYQGRNVQASWKWRIGNHLDGAASMTYVRTLASLDDYLSLSQRLRTDRRKDVDFRWQTHPRWQVRGAIGRYDLSYNNEAQRSAAREETTGEVGLDYLAPTGTSIGVLARRLNGSYPFPFMVGSSVFQNDYEQDELRARFDWSVAGKTRVQFSGGVVSRKHAQFVAKNFRGGNARTNLDWTVSRKTSLSASAWRQLGISDDPLTAYSVNRGVSVGPRWVVTQMLQTDFMFRYESRDFRSLQALVNNDGYGDVFHTIQWSTTYAPSEHWMLQSSVFRVKKDGTGRLTSFHRNGATMTLQYIF